VVAGYAPVMPSYQAGQSSEEDIQALIAYLKSSIDRAFPARPRRRAGAMSYLDQTARRLRSWLLTTDHKRIALLYAVDHALLLPRRRGGHADPAGAGHAAGRPGLADTYNKLFTLHGVIMVWLFLIPSIPSVLGNFLMPLMIGARDLASRA
jgi:cytochrome c oxidase subunit 1